MILPYMNIHPSIKQVVTDTFRGLNQNIILNNNEFQDMKNISTRFYPALATRPERGTLEKQFINPKGIFYKNGLFYIDGTSAVYNDVQRFTVTDTDKIIVGIGAYICVFPDKIMFNTFTGTVESMVATVTGTATFAPLSAKSVYTRIGISGIGNTFKNGDSVEISDCSNTSYNGYHVIIESGTDYIVISGTLETSFTDDSVTFKRKVPDMDFVCERDNRLWGCSSNNHEVYCCKAGDPKNWYNYEAEANNSWAATVGSDGNFTGISKFGTYLIFFKEHTYHILRGDKPANFSLLEKEQPGVKTGCSRSVITIDQVLYYVSNDGVYSYTGSIPRKISRNITGTISDAAACQKEQRLYLSCKLDGKQTLLVYDTTLDIWDIEDDITFKFAQYNSGSLHYVGSDNVLRPIYGDSDEDIEWYVETGDMTGNTLDMKYVGKVKINFWLEKGAEAYFYIKLDDDPMWVRKGYVRSKKNKTYTFPLLPRRCSKYRIRISGKGQMKILGMITEIHQGSEKNGSILTDNRR